MRSLLVRIGFCILVFGFCLYSYLAAQNNLTQLKMQLPALESEIALICEENRRLSYEVEQLQSPANLIEKARAPEFSHLKHPLLKEIVTVQEVFASNE